MVSELEYELWRDDHAVDPARMGLTVEDDLI